MTDAPDHAARTRAGALCGLGAYVLWGVLPGYFYALRVATPWEILGHRILWSLLVCLGVLAVRRELGELRDVLAQRGQLRTAALAAGLISVNWLTFLIAVTSGRVTEAALGYFVTPLVSIALGMVLLGERLRRLQAIAAVLGLVGALYLAIAARTPSWIAATLALSFGLYGLAKKRVELGAVVGLTVETAVLAPVAALVVWLGPGGSTFAGYGAGHALLLLGLGVVTAVPLILFAAAARRVTLVTLGLLQFVAPVLQFAFGLAIGEPMSAQRWIGFAIVWAALVVLSLDLLRLGRR